MLSLTTSVSRNSLLSAWREGIGLLLLTSVTASLAVGSSDVIFGDEIFYMARGLSITDGVRPAFQDSPGYSQIYFILSLLTDDRVGLYFVMRVLSSISLVLGIWLAARLVATPIIAWSIAATAAALPFPYLWPGVSGMPIAFLLIGFSGFIRYKSPVSLATMSIFTWLAAAWRPEFAWLATFLTLGALLWLGKQARHSDPALRTRIGRALGITATVGVPLMLILLYGSPFSGGRSWIAFSQHFSLRHALPSEDPWLDSGQIVQRSFPASHSLVDALATNPGAVMVHIFKNLLESPSVTWREVIYGAGTSPVFLIGAFMFILFAAATIFGLIRGSRNRAQHVKQIQMNNRPLLLSRESLRLVILGASAFALVLPVIVIFPRQHYLVGPMGLILLAMAYLMARFPPSDTWLLGTYILTFGALVGIVALTIREQINSVSFPSPVARTLTLMGQQDCDWRIYSDDWGVRTGMKTFVPGAIVEGPLEEADPRDLETRILSGSTNAIWGPPEDVAKLVAEMSDSGQPPSAGQTTVLRQLFPGSPLFAKDESCR